MQAAAGQRNDRLDIAKGLGIIAVVFGHSGAPFVNIVSLYHLALFFFISGYLYKDAYTANPWALIKNRIKTLYVPFVTYGLFFGILHNIFFKINIYTEQVQSQYNHVAAISSTRDYLLNLVKIASFAKVEQIVAPLWFLPVLFIVNVFFVLCSYAVHKFKPGRPQQWLALLIAAIFFTGFFFNPQTNLILRPVSIAMVVLALYYLGYTGKRHEGRIPFKIYYAALCLIVLLVCYPYGPIDTGGHQFVSPHFYLVCSLCGIYLNLYIAGLASRTQILKKFLIMAGRNTIAIMALHFLAFRAVSFLQVRLYDLPSYLAAKHPILLDSGGWWIAYLGAGVGLPLLGRAVYEKLRGYLRPRQEPWPV